MRQIERRPIGKEGEILRIEGLAGPPRRERCRDVEVFLRAEERGDQRRAAAREAVFFEGEGNGLQELGLRHPH